MVEEGPADGVGVAVKAVLGECQFKLRDNMMGLAPPSLSKKMIEDL